MELLLDFYWTSTGPLLSHKAAIHVTPPLGFGWTPHWTPPCPLLNLYWPSAGPLLDVYGPSNVLRLGLYWALTGPLLGPCWASTEEST